MTERQEKIAKAMDRIPLEQIRIVELSYPGGLGALREYKKKSTPKRFTNTKRIGY